VGARDGAHLRELGVRRRHWSSAQRPASGWAALTADYPTSYALLALITVTAAVAASTAKTVHRDAGGAGPTS
jgi:hypothetical protein